MNPVPAPAEKSLDDSRKRCFDSNFTIFSPAAARNVTQKPHGVTQKPTPAINKWLRRNNV
jgi:hypothetical protein